MKLITGVGEPLLGRVDHRRRALGRSREIAYSGIADAPEITTLIDYEVLLRPVNSRGGDG